MTFGRWVESSDALEYGIHAIIRSSKAQRGLFHATEASGPGWHNAEIESLGGQ